MLYFLTVLNTAVLRKSVVCAGLMFSRKTQKQYVQYTEFYGRVTTLRTYIHVTVKDRTVVQKASNSLKHTE